MKSWGRALLVCAVFVCGAASAQFLSVAQTVKPLNISLLNRWMETNKAISSYQSVINDMLPTDAEASAFDKLSSPEQDRLVNSYLQRKGMFEPLNSNMIKLCWSGVADYMRASSQIGNAIAAELQEERVAALTKEQAKAIMDKADPAVKAVSKADLDFIRKNKALISQYIQNYSASK